MSRHALIVALVSLALGSRAVIAQDKKAEISKDAQAALASLYAKVDANQRVARRCLQHAAVPMGTASVRREVTVASPWTPAGKPRLRGPPRVSGGIGGMRSNATRTTAATPVQSGTSFARYYGRR